MVWERLKKRRKKEVHHSRSFHRYFEDYCEHRVDLGDGTFRIERFYVGLYYRQDIPERYRVLLRLYYWLSYAASSALFIYGGTRPVGSNLFLGGIALQVVCTCLLVWMFFLLIAYTAAKREMEIRVYRETSLTLCSCALLLACCMGGTALVGLLYMLLVPEERTGPAAGAACTHLLSAALLLLLYRTERSIVYTTRPSERQAAPEDVLIEY